MTQYLLSVHSVEGEVSAPPTDEQMQQFHTLVGILEAELKSAAPGSSAVACTDLTRPPSCAYLTALS